MEKMLPIQKRLWAEIDLDAVKHNFHEAKRASREGVKVCCVIKANAYGHGAVELGRVYEDEGADMLAVSNLEEALELREGGIKLPILVLGYSPAECAEALAKYDVEQCVYSEEYAESLAECARAAGVVVKTHIKIDTGMGRIGFICRENAEEPSALAAAERACLLEGLLPVGIFTHFAVADGGEDGDEYTAEQNSAFLRAIDYLESRGISFAVKHCANSAAIYDHPECAFNMVRAGISLYGEPPSAEMRSVPDLRCTMTLRSVISNVKTVYPGESVGYGRTFVAEKPMRVATVPIGYADGLFRLGSGGADVFTVSGVGAPVLGRICMDQTMIDVTDIDGVKMGDEVIVFGDGGVFSVSDMARACKTIEYEIFCAISRRVPRVYIADGRVVSVRDYILSDKLNEKR